MRKSILVGIIFLLVTSFAAYSAPKSNFDKKTKLEVVCLLGYSENKADHIIEKEIWNKKIKVIDLISNSAYAAIYDSTQSTQIQMKVEPYENSDIDYFLEISTIFCYYAYIRANPAEQDLEKKALAHAIAEYDIISKGVMENNPQITFKDPRGFRNKLINKQPELASGSLYYFTLD